MIWFLLQKIGFWIFVGLSVYFTARKRMTDLMSLYFWGMTFATCYQFAITIWFPTKIVVLAMMICLIIYGSERRDSDAVSYIKPFSFTFITILIIGDLIGILTPAEYATHINKFSRIFNTNYTYITSIALLFYGCMMPRGFVKKTYPQYCLAMEVAIGFGILHFLCSKVGIEFMPILRQDGSVNLEALAEVGDSIMTRIYGVSGEPKGLAFLVCPYVLMMMVMYSQEKFRFNNPKYHIAMIILGIFVLINTYSSAALIDFAIATPLLLLFLPMKRLISKLIPPLIMLFALVGFVSLLKDTFADTPQKESPNMLEALYERSFGRAQDEMSGDRQERIILDYFIDDRDISVHFWGYGTAQYTFHIPGQTIGNALIPVQSGLVLTLVDFGLLGIVLYAWLFIMILRLLRKSYYSSSIYAIGFSVAALSSFIGSLMFGSIVSCFVYFMLALYAYYDRQEKENQEIEAI